MPEPEPMTEAEAEYEYEQSRDRNYTRRAAELRSERLKRTEEVNPIQENVRYWALIDEDGLSDGYVYLHRPKFTLEDNQSLVRITLKAVSDD